MGFLLKSLGNLNLRFGFVKMGDFEIFGGAV